MLVALGTYTVLEGLSLFVMASAFLGLLAILDARQRKDAHAGTPAGSLPAMNVKLLVSIGNRISLLLLKVRQGS